ncbi:unnamed protein product [Symbiodinium sp. KB8]|nr:unnamed protein product [Symbiodinium sp. KB8]
MAAPDVPILEDRQLQWAVPYFLVLFYDEAKTRSETCTAAERRKQLKKSFYTAASQRLCAEWHSAIWPGVCFPEPLPTKTKDGESLGRMSEKTCDTSIMIAALASKLGEPNTYPSTTRCCHRFLKEVVTLLARASEFTVALVDLQWFRASNCRVSADGTVDGNLFWGSTCDRVDKLKAIWRERLDDSEDSLVQTPESVPHVADIVAFAFHRCHGSEPDEISEEVKLLRAIAYRDAHQISVGRLAYPLLNVCYVPYAERMRAEFRDQKIFHDLVSTENAEKLAAASQGLQAAWRFIGKQVPELQESMWTTARYTSSMCTGVYTAESALVVAARIVNASRYFERKICFKPKEINKNCFQCIIDNHSWGNQATGQQLPMPCVFGDMMRLVPDGTLTGYESFEDARAAIYSADTVQWQECRVHGTSCLLPHVDFDMSGLPCVDNSQMKQCNGPRQFEEGPTGPLFCVWALRLRRYHVPLAVLENTPATRIAAKVVCQNPGTASDFALPCANKDLHVQILESLLGDLCNVYPLRVEPADIGHSGVSRARLYVIVAMKTARVLADPVQLVHSVADHVRARFQTKPRDYLIAGDLEVQFEAFATASAAGVPFRSNVLDLSYLLTKREAHAVERLNELYTTRTGDRPESNPDLCYFLGDDPSFTVNWSAISNRVPVLRRNAGKIWFPAEKRWMTSAEKLLTPQLSYMHLLACMTFPVEPHVASSLLVPAMGTRDTKRAAQLLGNAMSLQCACLVYRPKSVRSSETTVALMIPLGSGSAGSLPPSGYPPQGPGAAAATAASSPGGCPSQNLSAAAAATAPPPASMHPAQYAGYMPGFPMPMPAGYYPPPHNPSVLPHGAPQPLPSPGGEQVDDGGSATTANRRRRRTAKAEAKKGGKGGGPVIYASQWNGITAGGLHTRLGDDYILKDMLSKSGATSLQGDFANTSYLDTLPDDVLHSLSWWYWGKHPHDKLTAEEKANADKTANTLLQQYSRRQRPGDHISADVIHSFCRAWQGGQDSFRLNKHGSAWMLDNGHVELDISAHLDSPYHKVYCLRLEKSSGRAYVIATESSRTSVLGGGLSRVAPNVLYCDQVMKPVQNLQQEPLVLLAKEHFKALLTPRALEFHLREPSSPAVAPMPNPTPAPTPIKTQAPPPPKLLAMAHAGTALLAGMTPEGSVATPTLPGRCACGEPKATCSVCGLGYAQQIPESLDCPSSSEDEALVPQEPFKLHFDSATQLHVLTETASQADSKRHGEYFVVSAGKKAKAIWAWKAFGYEDPAKKQKAALAAPAQAVTACCLAGRSPHPLKNS